MFWNRPIKNSSSIVALYSQRHKIILTFSSLYLPPTILQYYVFLFTFVAIAIAVFLCAASQIVVLVYLLGGFRSFQRYYISFLIILYVIWFCFSKKIACGHPFHYLLIKMFWSLRTNRRRLPEKFLNLIFNFIFYVALLSLYVFPMFRRSFL